MAERTQSLTRRKFLFTVGAGGAAAAAAAAAALAAKRSGSASPDPAKRATRGYHATEHVNNYYRTTQV